MVQLAIAKDLTRVADATATRNHTAVETVVLCWIAVVNTSSYHCRWTLRRCSWGGRWRVTASSAAAVDIKHVVHIRETNASRCYRVRIAAIWRAEVARPGFGIRVRTDDEEVVFRGLVWRQHFHHQLKGPGWNSRG